MWCFEYGFVPFFVTLNLCIFDYINVIKNKLLIVYNTFIKKYNDKYSESLLEEQKELINKYLTSYADNKLELKIYLNEEVGRIKSKIANFMDSNTITNKSTLNRFNGVLTVIYYIL